MVVSWSFCALKIDKKSNEGRRLPKSRVPSGLRYFYSVATFGSFSAAAEKLAVAPSAINCQVAALEERLGKRLFDRARGRGGLQLTDVGAVLYSRMTSVMNEHIIRRLSADRPPRFDENVRQKGTA